MKMNNNIREKINNINNRIKNENRMKELIKPNNQLHKNAEVKEKENENKKIKDSTQNKEEAEKVINNSNNNKNLNMNKDTNLAIISKIKENLNEETLRLKKNKSQKMILKDNQSKINVNSLHKRVKSYEKF